MSQPSGQSMAILRGSLSSSSTIQLSKLEGTSGPVEERWCLVGEAGVEPALPKRPVYSRLDLHWSVSPRFSKSGASGGSRTLASSLATTRPPAGPHLRLCPRSESNRALRFTKAVLRLGATGALHAELESNQPRSVLETNPLPEEGAKTKKAGHLVGVRPLASSARSLLILLGAAPPIEIDRDAGLGGLQATVRRQTRDGGSAEALFHPVHFRRCEHGCLQKQDGRRSP